MRLISKVTKDAAKYSKLVQKVHMARYRLMQSIEEWQVKCADVAHESDDIAQDMIMKLNEKKAKRERIAKAKLKAKPKAKK